MFSKLKEYYNSNKLLFIITIILLAVLIILIGIILYKLAKILLLLLILGFILVIISQESKNKEEIKKKGNNIIVKKEIKEIPVVKKIVETKSLNEIKEKEKEALKRIEKLEEEKEKELKKVEQEKKENEDEHEIINLKVKEENNKIKEIEASLYKNGIKENSFHTIITNQETKEDIINNAIQVEEKTAYNMLSNYLKDNIKDNTIIIVENEEKIIQLLKEKIEELENIDKIENIENISNLNINDIKNNIINNYKTTKVEKENSTEKDKNISYESSYIYSSGINKKDIKPQLTNEELLLCSYIGKILINNNKNLKQIDFLKDKEGYINVDLTNIKFKVDEDKKHLIVPKNEKTSLKTEPCSENENKESNKRVLIEKNSDIFEMSNFINEQYKKKEKKEKVIYGLFFTLKEKDIERIQKKEKNEELVNDYIRLARKELEEKNYTSSIQILKNGINRLREENMHTGRLKKELKKVNKEFEEEKKKKKREEELRKVKKLD